MYDPPLNLTLARHVDFVAKSNVEVQDVIDFLPGTGCEYSSYSVHSELADRAHCVIDQLFLADPENATIVYCESPVFDIEDDPEVALARRRDAANKPVELPASSEPPPPAATTTTAQAQDEPTSKSEEPPQTTSAEDQSTMREAETTEAPAPEEPAASSSSWWPSSVSSMFSSSSEAPPPPAEDTSRAPIVIVRPSPPPARSEEPAPPASEPPPPPPPPSTTEVAPTTTSTSITPPPTSSSEPPAPPPPPPPSSSSIDSSSSSASSSRDFYWYYSVSPSASSVAPSSTVEAAKAIATVDANAPCTCGGSSGTIQNVNTGGGTGFQILIRPIPGTHGDEGLQLFTAGADRATRNGFKVVSGIVVGVVLVLRFL